MPFNIPFNMVQIYYANVKIPNILLTGTGTAQIAVLESDLVISTNNSTFTSGRAVATGAGTYYAVGSGSNTMAYSSDGGNTWTAVSGSPFTTAGYDILYTGSVWVAAGEGGNTLAYYDNTSWVPITTGLTLGRRLYYDSITPRIYAMGSGANTFAYTSAVDVSWNGIKTYVSKGRINAIGGPATYNRTWVGTCDNAGSYKQLISSTTPDISTSWIEGFTTTGAYVFQKNANYVNHGTDSNMNKLWVAVGGYSAGNLVGYSSTGVGNSWSQALVATIYATGVAYGSDANGVSLWLIGGMIGSNDIQYSRNGSIWTSLGDLGGIISMVSYGSDVAGDPLWVVVNGTTMKYSKVGTDPLSIWTSSSNVSNCCGLVTDIKCGTDGSGNTLWVAVGQSASNGNTVGYSTDGAATWTGVVDSSFSAFGLNVNGVEYGSDGSKPLWVIVGNSGKIFYSYNAKKWTLANSTLFTNLMKITYGISSSGNPQWIATGGNSTNGNDIGFSSDGKVWTAIFVNTATGFNSYITMITVSKEPKYILGGTGPVNMKGSFDGITWYFIQSPFSTSTNDVYWYGGKWVAVGEGGNTIAYSSDGRKWYGSSTTFTIRGNRVKYISGKWYASGEGGNTFVQSGDGVTWTTITTSIDVSGAGFC